MSGLIYSRNVLLQLRFWWKTPTLNDFKSLRHFQQSARPLSTEVWSSLRSMGLLKRFRGNNSRNNNKSGPFPIQSRITTNLKSNKYISTGKESRQANHNNLIEIHFQSDGTTEADYHNKRSTISNLGEFVSSNSPSIVNNASDFEYFAVSLASLNLQLLRKYQ